MSCQADVAAAMWCERQLCTALRAMLLSALSVSPLFGDSVHRMRSVFSGYQGGAAIFRAAFLLRGVGQVRIAQSPYARSEAHSGNDSRGPPPLQGRRCARIITSSSYLHALSSSIASLSRLVSGALGVAQWLVDLSAHPQTVQEHTELSRHGHRSPFLCVLACAGGYLLPVASEVRVRAERTQDVVSVAHQEPTLSISSPSLEMCF